MKQFGSNGRRLPRIGIDTVILAAGALSLIYAIVLLSQT